jgi:Kef-type K+ transport system membrane component KefB
MIKLDSAQLFMLQFIILVGLPYLLWSLDIVRKWVPLVVIQIVLGLFLGPSVLGKFSNEIFQFLFPKESITSLQVLTYMALIPFGFMTGLHLNIDHLKGKGKGFIITSISSILVPLILCSLLGIYLFNCCQQFVGSNATITTSSFAIGVALSVTALPVLTSILKEMGYLNNKVGRLLIAMASVNDAILWILVAIVLTSIKGKDGGIEEVFKTISFTIIYFVSMFKFIGPFIHNLLNKGFLKHETCHRTMVLIACFMFSSALLTDLIGIHYLLGAFTAGAIIPKELSRGINEKLERVTEVFLLPFFFMLTGLKTNFSVNDTDIWQLFAFAVLFSSVGKIIGVSIPAYFYIYNERVCPKNRLKKSLILGCFMQSKGLMEVVVLNILLQAEIISSSAFAGFLMMAVFTTAITKPSVLLCHRILGDKKAYESSLGGNLMIERV